MTATTQVAFEPDLDDDLDYEVVDGQKEAKMAGARHGDIGVQLITELNNYLCEFFNKEHHVKLLQLTTSSNLEISRIALEVIDNLIYFTKDSCSDYLLENDALEVLMQLIDR